MLRGARFAWRYLRGSGDARWLASASVGIGLFIGCLPLYGLHLPLCLLVCLPLRLDAVLAYLAANISNPLVAPFLLFIEVQTGALLLDGRFLSLNVERLQQLGVAGLLLQTAVGSLVVAAVVAASGAVLAWPLSGRRTKPAADALEAAIQRVIARYQTAPVGDRFYVAMKLVLDPAVPELARLAPKGRVLDAGAGRGQMSLLLVELGAATEVFGFDWDARKIEAARRAAGGAGARYQPGGFFDLDWPESDAVLLIDVLHYLPAARQKELLERARRCLRPGGVIIVRDVDARPGLRTRLTQALERIATRSKYNVASVLEFRPAAEIVRELQELGFSDVTLQRSGGTLLANVLIAARR